jgi:hypothetical protein
MAPVAQLATDSVEDSLQKQRCTKWLQYINGCAGEFGGLLLQRVLAPPYVEWLEQRVGADKPAMPGSDRQHKRFLDVGPGQLLQQ